MECPFKTPAKYEMKITTTEYIVVDAERKVIAKCSYEDDALFIQEAINNYEKLANALNTYGNHNSKCKYLEGLKGGAIEECDCGLDQALKELEVI